MLPPSIVHVAFYNSKKKRGLLLISIVKDIIKLAMLYNILCIVSSRRSKSNNKNMGKTNKSDVQEDEKSVEINIFSWVQLYIVIRKDYDYDYTDNYPRWQ